ncbi:MAG: cysteine-rich CWC family protein [Pyrinomonadaceae bacterium]
MSGRVKRFAAVISPRWREPSTCEACGGEFTCGATLSGCWCSEIKLSDAQRAELRERYKECLCRNCLKSVMSGSVNFKDRDLGT